MKRLGELLLFAFLLVSLILQAIAIGELRVDFRCPAAATQAVP
jgi:hypothetical protein